ncbi:MAG: hypothetical protein KJO06_07935 [Gemmatimonadetes bacterium]|nr:hypothetical protein [Gemmatimonadota bacterium]NNK48378.1 hypothetical protein [Gemmatimonadota bacterium]
MKKAAVLGAVIAATATAVVGAIALMGATRIPVAEYLLFPGSMAAWLHKGDNFRSSQEFLATAIALGVPINALVGAGLGVLLMAVRRRPTNVSAPRD